MLKNRTVRIIIGLGIVGALIAALLFVVYIWIPGGTIQSTTPISAPTIVGESDSDETRVLLRIVPDESEVRFRLNEVLMGNPTEVVGITNQVAGDLLVDFQMPANTEVGTIRIDLATIATNNEMRNRALRSRILESTTNTAFQYAEFTPTALNGLPETITMGTAFSFQIVGNLTVHGVTDEVTFETTVTPVSEERIEGTAITQVLYPDYNMVIPNAPGVANVTEEVMLEIDFVATTVSAATQ